MNLKTTGQFACLILLSLGAVSCSISPAALKPISPSVISSALTEESPGGLLEEALRAPFSDPSKIALGHFVEQWAKQRACADKGEVIHQGADGDSHRYEVVFRKEMKAGMRGLKYFDSIRTAADFKVKRIERFQREGIGAPLLAMRENEGKEPIERYFPPEGISRALTAVITKKESITGGTRVEISLLSSLQHETVVVDGETQPLAGDFSVAWAGLLERAGNLQKIQFIDALTPDPKLDPQLYLMEPYDPEKEPVIMIHGLFSSPLVWAELSNQLWADKAFRSRYQIWHYLYNTSAPALYSGRILRTQLRELRPMLNPTLDDPAMQSTTVIAHSMGGIVTRSLITRPEERFWEAAFTRPLSALNINDDQRETLKRAFYWEPESHVKRAIYIAVPHRGSEFAENIVGKIGRSLVKPPSEFSKFYSEIYEANPGVFTPAYDELGQGKLDSVHSLSPKQPTLKILAAMPNSHPVETYSIIGDRGRKAEIDDISDGIVEYASAHLKWATAEVIVPANHSKAVEAAATLEEILRILTDPSSISKETRRISKSKPRWFHDSTGSTR